MMSIIIIGGSPAFEIDQKLISKKIAFISNFIKIVKGFYKETKIFAVDKGLELLELTNFMPDKIIGDFDSVDPKILKKYPSKIQKSFPAEKDRSDGELAVDMALKTQTERIFLLNMEGARIDHFLFNIYLLKKAPIKIKMITKDEIIFCLNPKRWMTLDIERNKTFSLIPLSPIRSLTITGAKYPLDKKDFPISSNVQTLTLSNISNGKVKIYYESGDLLFYLLEPDFRRELL